MSQLISAIGNKDINTKLLTKKHELIEPRVIDNPIQTIKSAPIIISKRKRNKSQNNKNNHIEFKKNRSLSNSKNRTKSLMDLNNASYRQNRNKSLSKSRSRSRSESKTRSGCYVCSRSNSNEELKSKTTKRKIINKDFLEELLDKAKSPNTSLTRIDDKNDNFALNNKNLNKPTLFDKYLVSLLNRIT